MNTKRNRVFAQMHLLDENGSALYSAEVWRPLTEHDRVWLRANEWIQLISNVAVPGLVCPRADCVDAVAIQSAAVHLSSVSPSELIWWILIDDVLLFPI